MVTEHRMDVKWNVGRKEGRERVGEGGRPTRKGKR